MAKLTSETIDALIQRERDAKRGLRRAAQAYAEVCGVEDDNVWDSAWSKLREAALAYATATHDATRARAAKESR